MADNMIDAEGEMPAALALTDTSTASDADSADWQSMDRRRSALAHAIDFHRSKKGNVKSGANDVVETARKFDTFLEG